MQRHTTGSTPWLLRAETFEQIIQIIQKMQSSPPPPAIGAPRVRRGQVKFGHNCGGYRCGCDHYNPDDFPYIAESQSDYPDHVKDADVVMNATVVKHDDPKTDPKTSPTRGEVKGPLGGREKDTKAIPSLGEDKGTPEGKHARTHKAVRARRPRRRTKAKVDNSPELVESSDDEEVVVKHQEMPDSDSDSEDEDRHWLDELLKENKVSQPGAMTSGERSLAPTDETASVETSEGQEVAGTLCPITVATEQDKDFRRVADEARERCREERVQAERTASGGTGLMAAMLAAMGRPASGEMEHKRGEWRLMSIAVDSGAAETVIPHTLVADYPILETAKSKAGLCYASATGAPIPNLGEQKLPMGTAEGSLRMMTFQAAPVSKPLASVKRIIEAGHIVVFGGADCSYIQNVTTGEVNWLREEHGNYMLDVWIPPAHEANGWHQPFGRQP